MPTYSGRVRTITLGEDSYKRHGETIRAWLDGQKVETYFGKSQGWLHIINPNFDYDLEYRVADQGNTVLPGQKWIAKHEPKFRVTVFGLGLGVVYFHDQHMYNHVCSAEVFNAVYNRIPKEIDHGR